MPSETGFLKRTATLLSLIASCAVYSCSDTPINNQNTNNPWPDLNRDAGFDQELDTINYDLNNDTIEVGDAEIDGLNSDLNDTTRFDIPDQVPDMTLDGVLDMVYDRNDTMPDYRDFGLDTADREIDSVELDLNNTSDDRRRDFADTAPDSVDRGYVDSTSDLEIDFATDSTFDSTIEVDLSDLGIVDVSEDPCLPAPDIDPEFLPVLEDYRLGGTNIGSSLSLVTYASDPLGERITLQLIDYNFLVDRISVADNRIVTSHLYDVEPNAYVTFCMIPGGDLSRRVEETVYMEIGRFQYSLIVFNDRGAAGLALPSSAAAQLGPHFAFDPESEGSWEESCPRAQEVIDEYGLLDLDEIRHYNIRDDWYLNFVNLMEIIIPGGCEENPSIEFMLNQIEHL